MRGMGTPVQWLDDDEQRVWRQWLRVHARLNARLTRQLMDDCRLSLPDFEVLVTLSERAGHRMRVVALAEGIKWERSRLSHHLTRMEKRGLIERQECPQDRRGAFVAITSDGMTALEGAAPGHVAEVRASVFDVLTADELSQLDHVTAKLLAKLSDEEFGDA